MTESFMKECVRWKGLITAAIALAGVIVAAAIPPVLLMTGYISKVESNSVSRREFLQSENYNHKFMQEYREDQKIQNELLRELLQQVSKLEHK